MTTSWQQQQEQSGNLLMSYSYEEIKTLSEKKEPELQAQLLNEIHDQVSTAHSEKIKILQLIRACFYWPTGWKDVE